MHAFSRASNADEAVISVPRLPIPWYRRLLARRISSRKVAAYIGVVAVFYFSAPWAPTFLAGCVLLLLAGGLRVWTYGHLRKNQAMITTGPYAYTRNPAYLGSLLALLGFGIAAGNPYTTDGRVVWLLSVAFLLLFLFSYLPRKYAREYPRLYALFPEQYTAHASNVPDLWPRLTPWRSGDPHRFCWRRVHENHEFFWPLVVTTGMLVMWFS